MGARYYAPWLGRWTTADPIGLAAGVNPYLYCRAGPVTLSDPSGLDDSLDLITAAFGPIATAVAAGVQKLQADAAQDELFGVHYGSSSTDDITKKEYRVTQEDLNKERPSSRQFTPGEAYVGPGTDDAPAPPSVTAEPDRRGSKKILGLGLGGLQGATPLGFVADVVTVPDKDIQTGRGVGQMIVGGLQIFGGAMLGGGTLGALVLSRGGTVAATPGGLAAADVLIAAGVVNLGLGAVMTAQGMEMSASDEPSAPAAGPATDPGGSPPGPGAPDAPGGGAGDPPRIVSRIKESPKLVREAEKAGRSQQRGIDALTKQLAAGNLDPGIGTRPIGAGISEARHSGGARVYFRQTPEGGIEILGKSDKGKGADLLRRLEISAS